MIQIDGLFARAEALALNLLDLLETDPDRGQSVLEGLVEETRKDLETAQFPLIYRLSGPEPAKATPMQYGGFFLERDRELLEQARTKGEVWLYIDAGADAYLDFVSDLPADVFAWDAQRTGFSLSEMRKLRSGLLSCNEPGADQPLSALNGDKEVAKSGV